MRDLFTSLPFGGGSVCIFSYVSVYRLLIILYCCVFLPILNVILKSAIWKSKIILVSFLPQDFGHPKVP